MKLFQIDRRKVCSNWIQYFWWSISYYFVWIDADENRYTSYGSTVTDGTTGGYQTNDPFSGITNGNYTNIQGRNNEQITSIPLTIENPMYRNYR